MSSFSPCFLDSPYPFFVLVIDSAKVVQGTPLYEGLQRWH